MRETTADQAILTDVLNRVVATADPEKIILFGSAARGDMTPNSDLDLLVVARNGTHRRQLAQLIYRRMIGVGHPVDVVVVTPDDVERYGSALGLIIEPALREGKVVYERPTAVA
jgi:predicted nucleotidyltransferase